MCALVRLRREVPPLAERVLLFLDVPPGEGDDCPGEIETDVTLEVPADPHLWPVGADRPWAVVGKHPDDPKHYRVFRSEAELTAAGFHHVPGTYGRYHSWQSFPSRGLNWTA